MDFNKDDNLFVAHPGYYKDKLIHYYKFRMHTPSTYPGQIAPGNQNTIPTVPLYVLTTSGDITGFVGFVISKYPGGEDAEEYSDFVQIHYVTVPEDEIDNVKSEADVLNNGFTIKSTKSYINAPVVPKGARLEDIDGESIAPIDSISAWYKGEEVDLYTFESTSEGWAKFLNDKTRDGTDGYEMVVVPTMILSADSVRFEPIWHFNQYFFGVTQGENNGGPAGMGQRNVIDVDRKDPNYSPLWQVFWITQVPLGYEADQVSNSDDITPENGFELIQTPMYVNCPNIGPHFGSDRNTKKAESFDNVPTGDKVEINGALVMRGDEEVTAFSGDEELATETTGMMGAFSFTLDAKDLDEEVIIEDKDGKVVATYPVE